MEASGAVPTPSAQEVGSNIPQEVVVEGPTVLSLSGMTMERGLRFAVGRNPAANPGAEDVDIHLRGQGSIVSRRALEMYFTGDGGVQLVNVGQGALEYSPRSGESRTLFPATYKPEESATYFPPGSDLRNIRVQVGTYSLEVRGLHQASGEPQRVSEIMIRPIGQERKQIDWGHVPTIPVQPK